MKVTLCKSCGSFRHLMSECPDSWENLSKVQSVNIMQHSETVDADENVLFTLTQDDEDVVLLTGFNKDNAKLFSKEARKCAVLDSACSSTVCGESWLEDYLMSLDEKEREKVSYVPSDKMFKFGGGERLKSGGHYIIPATVVGKEILIKTDVVQSDIPLLLSKESMKKAGVKLDLQKDTAEIFGVDVTLNETSSGHYCVPIDKQEEFVCAVKLEQMNDEEKFKTIQKLHRQFAHPPQKKLKLLLSDAGVWKDDYEEIMTKIYDRCGICKLYKKTPPRPVVALPMASRFNQKVCIDLKKWNDKWILHLIDMFSRFSVSVFVNRKKTSEIIDKIMQCWVGAFGVMEAILHDNGGEFSSDEMREVCSILNIETMTTAAESPFQNGLCERNHAVVDSMLAKMEEQCPDTPIEVLLCLANMAKNSLQMNHGFSSYQLVFGLNPNLPNVMCEKPPALEGVSSSKVLVKHLNSLHAARQAFIESEADERIRRALRSKIRASEKQFSPGDKVYYKRDGSERWMGPGKVVFQDGKVIFVRHGGVFVRVSPNRLIDTETSDMVKEENSSQCFKENSIVEQPDGCEELLNERDQVHNRPDKSQRLNTDEMNLKKNDKIEFKVNEGDEKTNAVVLGRAGKATGQYNSWYNIREADGNEKSIDLNGVAHWQQISENYADDDNNVNEVNIVLIPRERHQEDMCVKAKETELNKLQEFDTYEEVDDVGQFRISTTWVLWNKGNEVRARLVARGYEDEQCYPKDSPTIGKSAMRMIMAISASKNWKIKTTDIKSAFLQGKEMDREVFLTPPREASTERGKLWKLKHCLYGLNDAARQFYHSVVEFLKSVNCIQSNLDPALFTMIHDGELIGLVACHVDDFLHAGTPAFDGLVMDKLRKRFLAGKVEGASFLYVGFSISQDENGITMDHSGYMRKLQIHEVDPARALDKQEFLNPDEQKTFRQLVGRIN